MRGVREGVSWERRPAVHGCTRARCSTQQPCGPQAADSQDALPRAEVAVSAVQGARVSAGVVGSADAAGQAVQEDWQGLTRQSPCRSASTSKPRSRRRPSCCTLQPSAWPCRTWGSASRFSACKQGRSANCVSGRRVSGWQGSARQHADAEARPMLALQPSVDGYPIRRSAPLQPAPRSATGSAAPAPAAAAPPRRRARRPPSCAAASPAWSRSSRTGCLRGETGRHRRTGQTVGGSCGGRAGSAAGLPSAEAWGPRVGRSCRRLTRVPALHAERAEDEEAPAPQGWACAGFRGKALR